MSKGLPQMDWNLFPTQIFWLVITFAILYIIVKSLVLPRIEGAIALREKAMDSDLEEVKRLQKEAFLMSKTYDERIEKAKKEANDLVSAKSVEAKNYLSTQEASLSNALKVKTEQAESQITAFKNQLNAQLVDVVSDVTQSILNRTGLSSLSVNEDNVRTIIQTQH